MFTWEQLNIPFADPKIPSSTEGHCRLEASSQDNLPVLEIFQSCKSPDMFVVQALDSRRL